MDMWYICINISAYRLPFLLTEEKFWNHCSNMSTLLGRRGYGNRAGRTRYAE